MATAAITAGAGLVSGILGGKGAKKAAKAQAQSDAQAIAEQRREFDINQVNFAPWLESGKEALGGQGDLLGLNGAGVQQTSIDALKASPLYQSLFRNGQDTILNNASASGGLRGGNIQSSLANFGSDTLAQVIQQQLANLGGLSGQGLSGAGGLGSLNANSADSISKLLSAQGDAKAGGILGATKSYQSAIPSIGNLLGGIKF